ncbi:MAG TPA: glutamyl-tRNA reductase, partial [Chloroflexota bacterium]|nr:glutamyl-tRNA reductase [Chloroflexota bacterium]
ISVVGRSYMRGDLAEAMLAVAATSDSEVNRAVAAEASERNILVNVVDVPDLCNFIVPSVIRRDELTVAISTGGLSPSLAKHIRQKLEETLVPEYGAFLRMLGTLRARVRRELALPAQREAFWSEVVNSDAFDVYRSRGEADALRRIEDVLVRIREGEPCVVLAVGLNHQMAPVEVRERLAFDAEGVRRLLARLGAIARERVVVSTCNRMEIYMVPIRPRQADGEVRRLLQGFQQNGQPKIDLSPFLYTLHNERVAEHLFSVAAGIDSMILGEPQILGQVRDAYESAAEAGTTGSILSVMFQRALAAGKRARTETGIARSAVSVSHAAVELARRVFGEISTRTVLVVGAGEMAELAAKNLADNGVGRILVVNRTRERAVELAARFGGTGLGWGDLPSALIKSDIVITSTGSQAAIFNQEMVAPIMRVRRQPLLLVDIAVPRDVDPEVGEIEDVFLYDIDDLQGVVEANLKEREKEVCCVEAIVQEEAAGFASWLHCQDVIPTIVALRERVEQIRRSEVERHVGRLKLSERELAGVDALTEAIINKILHMPTVRLKAQANDGACGLYVDAVRELFDLQGDA